MARPWSRSPTLRQLVTGSSLECLEPMHLSPGVTPLLTVLFQAGWLVVPTGLGAQAPVQSVQPDPPRTITQYVHTAWTAKDGAPADVRALAQTTDGYLWLGGPGGLFRFDGARFVRFEPKAGEILPTTSVSGLLAGHDGSLWIIWQSGAVSHLTSGHLTSYSVAEGLPRTTSLIEDAAGLIMAGTDRGLTRLQHGVWRDIGPEWGYPAEPARVLYYDRAGTLWVFTGNRVVYLPRGQHQFVDAPKPVWFKEAEFDLQNLAEGPDSAIWISETGRSAHTIQRLGDHQPITEVQVGAQLVLFDRHGSLWVGSVGDGLRRVSDPTRITGQQVAQFGPEAEQFTTEQGLSGNVVNTGLEDREGNVWFGTLHGLDRFREAAFVPVPVPHPDRARILLGARDGSLWTSAWGDGSAVQIDSVGRTLILPPRTALPALVEDSLGELWGVDGRHLVRYRSGLFQAVALPGDHPPSHLFGITVDPAGALWLLDYEQGVFRFSNHLLTRVASRPRPVSSWGFLWADRSGRVWLGEYARVMLLDHGRVQEFGASDGVPPGSVLTFFEDRAGNTWVGGLGGLAKYEHDRFHLLTGASRSSLRSISGVIEDNDGGWWMASNQAVVRIAPAQLERALADSTYRVAYQSFDFLDGLPGTPQTTGPEPTAARTRDGRIWFATGNGLAYVDPRRIPRNSQPPSVQVETVKIDGREVAADSGLSLAHGVRDVEIDYTATSLSIPERVNFRYQFEGRETEWHDAGTRRQAYFTGLPPGAYRFRVIASNNDGVWNQVGATWSFRVVPAFYQTVWFLALCLLTGGGLIWWAATTVVRRRHRLATVLLKSQFDGALAERSRIAQDLHDTLLQGFAGVAMQLKRARVALPEQPDVADETLAVVERLTAEALRETRESVWDMGVTELDKVDLAEALEARARAAATGTNLVITLTTQGERRRLSRALETTAFRIGREAVANAVKHAEARRIDIEVEFAAAVLILRVRDDGRGFTEAEGEAARQTGHFGLTGMRERARRAGGSCEVHPRPEGGTVVVLELPLKEPAEAPPRSSSPTRAGQD